MVRWFQYHAPIRAKFTVLAIIYMALSAMSLGSTAAVAYGLLPGMTGIIIAAAALAMVAIVAVASRQLICGPYVSTVVRMEGLAAGDLTSAINYTSSRDCVGRMTKAMEVFRANGQALAAASATQREVVEALGQGLGRLADSDLTHRIDRPFTADYEALRVDFNRAMTAVSDAIVAVTAASNGINSGASDIRQASDDLSQRTEQQAASLEETAAAMDEITGTVRETAAGARRANTAVSEARTEAESSGEVVRRAVEAMGGIERSSSEIILARAVNGRETAAGARRANTAVSEARTEAESSGEVVRRAVEAMGGIERSSSEISEIISVIDGIAFQTNLLALNAGVEAARAGDAGRGFAVVASEVRALAQRSADAAKDVKTKILASTEQVDAGVSLVSETGKALQRIIARIGEVSTLVSTIASSAEHQATGLQQVNTAVSEMDGVTQQNAAMVEEATAAARSLAQDQDPRLDRAGRRRRVAGQRDRQGAATHHRPHRGGQHARLDDRLVRRASGDRAAAGEHRRLRDGRGDAAECRDGRGSDRRRAQPRG
ncbi:hypothetical protein ASE95_04920 [Sphingomonas sp. Leaf231]|nr:hypothetical protein ASE95_04920 [Sphingomonas sp. Leaf231]